MAENKPILGYWKIRGLAEPLRALLWNLDIDFEDQLYEMGEGPEFSREEWLSVKETLGLELPNLPYFIDGEVKLTQTFAIAKYIANKYHKEYLGTTEAEKLAVWVMEGFYMDIKSIILSISYDPHYNAHKRAISVELITTQLTSLANHLHGKAFVAGEHLTYLDFFYLELLENLEDFEPGLLNSVNEEVYSRYLRHVKAQHRVRDFENRAPRMTYNNKVASWNK